jgi:outer membrane autotransporter protein
MTTIKYCAGREDGAKTGRAGRRSTASWRCVVIWATLLLAGAASAQEVNFVAPSNYDLRTGESTPVAVATTISGVPVSGGTLTWSFDSVCDAATWTTQPGVPDASGTTIATLTALQPGFCGLSVSWDPDGTGPGLSLSTSPFQGLVFVSPVVTLLPISVPGTLAPGTDPSDVSFDVRGYADGVPGPSIYLQMTVTDPSGDIYQTTGCLPTDATGEVNFILSDATNMMLGPPNTNEAGSWIAQIEESFGMCKAGARPKGGTPQAPPLIIPFQVATNTLSILSPSNGSTIAVGSNVDVDVEVRDLGGSPTSGEVVAYTVTNMSGTVASGVTAASDANGLASFSFNAPATAGPLSVHAELQSAAAVFADIMLQASPTYTFTVLQPSGGAGAVAPGAPVNLTLNLVDNATMAGAAGQLITLSADPPIPGLPSSVTTDASGNATATGTAPFALGTYTVSATATGMAGKAAGLAPLNELITLTVQNIIVATNDDFSATQIDGPSGGSTATVYANDTYNGSTVPDTAVASTITSNGGLTGVAINSAGNLVVPPGSLGGTYTVTYEVCESAAPSNCSSATAIVAVRIPVRTIVKAGTDESPTYPANVGGIGVQVLDDGVGATDTVVYTVLSGPIVLVDGNSLDVSSPYSESTNAFGFGGVNKRFTGTGLSVVSAHRISDPLVSVTFSFETFQYQLSDAGTPTSATLGQAFNLSAMLQRQGASTLPVSGAASTITFSQTGGPASVSLGATSDAGGGNYQSSVTLITAGTYTFQAQFLDPNPPPGFSNQPQMATVTYTVNVNAVSNTLEQVSGNNQSGPVGEGLPQALVVLARNNGSPQAGVPVTWTIGSGGSLQTPGGVVGSTVSTTTAPDGTAQVQVTLGPTAGGVSITASRDDAPGVSTGFVATAQNRLVILGLEAPDADSGNGATGAPGSSLPVAVLATRDGEPEAGVQIAWSVQGAGARANPEVTTTAGDGIARTSIVLDRSAQGTIVVRATRVNGGGNAVTYTLTAAGAAVVDSLQAIAGGNQSGAPGSTLADLVVRYTRDGLPLAGQPVSWSVTSGDAILVGSGSGTTGSDGTTSIGARLGDRAGVSVVTATSGALTATFTLNATGTGSPVMLRVSSGNNQRGPVGTRTDAPLVLQTFEIAGGAEVPVSGSDIRWNIVSGPGTFEGGATTARTTTDAEGLTALRLAFGTTAGEVIVRGQLGDTTQVVEASATAFHPNLRIVSGDGQSAAAGASLPNPLVVGIGDPGANKTLTGTIVSWRVVSGAGQLGSASSNTDAQGQAQNTLRLGSASGATVVEARLSGGAAVQFTATAGVAAGATLSIVSGSPQTLATNEPSAPLVVSLVDSANSPISGARINWAGSNAEPRDATTTTGANGQTQTTAVLFDASGGSVTASVEGSNLRVVFALNGGVAETSGLNPDQVRNAELVDALCPALEARQSSGTPLNAGEADLLARCLEIEQSAGPRPEEVQEALTELVTQIATVLSDAALDTLRTQLGNHSVRFEQLRNARHGGIAQNMGIGLWTPDGLVSLSLLPTHLNQAEGPGEGGGEIGPDFDRWGFFATGTVGRGESRADSRSLDYDFDTSGLTAGVDYRFNDRIVGGVSLGYANHDTDLADDRGALDTSGWTISGYGTWYNERNWFVDGVLSYGSNSYDMTRRISYDITALDGGRTVVDQVAAASTDSSQLGGSLSVGRDFQKGAWNLSTYLRGDYSRISFDGYAERAIAGSAGEGLVLTVDPRDLTSLAATLGGKATYIMSRDWGILMPHVQLELQQEFKDDPQRLSTRFSFDPTQTTALFEGQDIDSSLYNLGLGLSALFPGGKSAYVYYERLMGSSQIKQDTLSLGVRIEF